MLKTVLIVECNRFHFETLMMAVYRFAALDMKVTVVSPHISSELSEFFQDRYGADVNPSMICGGFDLVFFNTIENLSSLKCFFKYFSFSSSVEVLLHNTHFLFKGFRELTLKRKILRAFLRPFLLGRCVQRIMCLSENMKDACRDSCISLDVLSNPGVNEFAEWCHTHMRCNLEILTEEYGVVLGGVDERKRSICNFRNIDTKGCDIYVLGKSQFSGKVSMGDFTVHLSEEYISDFEFYQICKGAKFFVDISKSGLYGDFKTSATDVISRSMNKPVVRCFL